MDAITEVRIQCALCGTRFPPPISISAMSELDEFAAWGGVIDCVHCHHFVEVCKANLSYTRNTEPIDLQMQPSR